MRGFRFLPSAIAAAAAAGTLAILGSGVAQAGTPAACSGQCTQASVSVAQAMTITDNTPSITWTNAQPGVGQNADTPVSISVSSNVAAGYAVSVTATDAQSGNRAGMGGAKGDGVSDFIPWSALQVQPQGGAFTAGVAAGTSQVYAADTSSKMSAAGGDNYADFWALTIPTNQGADSYTANLLYSVSAGA